MMKVEIDKVYSSRQEYMMEKYEVLHDTTDLSKEAEQVISLVQSAPGEFHLDNYNFMILYKTDKAGVFASTDGVISIEETVHDDIQVAFLTGRYNALLFSDEDLSDVLDLKEYHSSKVMTLKDLTEDTDVSVDERFNLERFHSVDDIDTWEKEILAEIKADKQKNEEHSLWMKETEKKALLFIKDGKFDAFEKFHIHVTKDIVSHTNLCWIAQIHGNITYDDIVKMITKDGIDEYEAQKSIKDVLSKKTFCFVDQMKRKFVYEPIIEDGRLRKFKIRGKKQHTWAAYGDMHDVFLSLFNSRSIDDMFSLLEFYDDQDMPIGTLYKGISLQMTESKNIEIPAVFKHDKKDEYIAELMDGLKIPLTLLDRCSTKKGTFERIKNKRFLYHITKRNLFRIMTTEMGMTEDQGIEVLRTILSMEAL